VDEVDERYPRPDLVRDGWTDLCGPWAFAYDDDGLGLKERWQQSAAAFDREIVVPFPPESALSGIGDPSEHPVVWYRRTVTVEEAGSACLDGDRLILHFGAVDYRSTVWVNGEQVGVHEGGHTPFSLDITDALPSPAAAFAIVVRAEDEVDDATQPRGKQTWRREPAGLYHPRTTGIWQPVWLERRSATAVERLTWTPDVSAARVRLTARLTTVPRGPVQLAVTVRLAGEVLAEQTVRCTGSSVTVDISLPDAADSRQLPRLLWSPDRPTLLDADVRLLDGEVLLDHVRSYIGYRSATVDDGAFLLNGRPCVVRAVLEQGFWPESHLAAPTSEALRREVELILELGFNGVRLHQKIEDPRFLYWCDRLGLLVWTELPSAFTYSPVTVQRLTQEWLEVLERDASHPCIVTWVVLNESWGVPHAADVKAQRDFAQALAALTRAVDPSRPVISNDGWEHVDSDILSIHDYTADPEQLFDRYADHGNVDRVVDSGRPWRGRIRLAGQRTDGRPVMLSEFGGISWAVSGEPGAWGYISAQDGEQYLDQLAAVFAAVTAARSLAGFCYTQLTDTATETNGLLDGARRPKLPMPQLRAAITGRGAVGVRSSAPVELVRPRATSRLGRVTATGQA
jgi:beta-galactosidase/beta-glucuronidase